MKVAAVVVLSFFLVIIGWQVLSFIREESRLGSQLADVQANLAKAKVQEASLQEENQYLSNPLNLEKELRARFNYKKPGEQMIIIVPPASSSVASTTN